MGQVQGKANIKPEIVPFVGLSTAAVISLWQAFNGLADGFGLELDVFAAICYSARKHLSVYTKQQDDDEITEDEFKSFIEPIFEIFDSDENGIIDSLEVLITLVACSATTHSFKINFMFEAYDFDGSEKLTIDELMLSFKTVLSGLCKIIDPSVADVKSEYLDKSNDLEIEKADINLMGTINAELVMKFARENVEVNSWLNHFDNLNKFFASSQNFEEMNRGLLEVAMMTSEKKMTPQLSGIDAVWSEDVLQARLRESVVKAKEQKQNRAWSSVVRETEPSSSIKEHVGVPDISLQLTNILQSEKESSRASYLSGQSNDIVLSSGCVLSIVSRNDDMEREKRFYTQHRRTVKCISAHPSKSDIVASASEDEILIWSAACMQTIKKLSLISARKGVSLKSCQVTHITFSENGETLIAIIALTDKSMAEYLEEDHTSERPNVVEVDRNRTMISVYDWSQSSVPVFTDFLHERSNGVCFCGNSSFLVLCGADCSSPWFFENEQEEINYWQRRKGVLNFTEEVDKACILTKTKQDSTQRCALVLTCATSLNLKQESKNEELRVYITGSNTGYLIQWGHSSALKVHATEKDAAEQKPIISVSSKDDRLLAMNTEGTVMIWGIKSKPFEEKKAEGSREDPDEQDFDAVSSRVYLRLLKRLNVHSRSEVKRPLASYMQISSDKSKILFQTIEGILEWAIKDDINCDLFPIVRSPANGIISSFCAHPRKHSILCTVDKNVYSDEAKCQLSMWCTETNILLASYDIDSTGTFVDISPCGTLVAVSTNKPMPSVIILRLPKEMLKYNTAEFVEEERMRLQATKKSLKSKTQKKTQKRMSINGDTNKGEKKTGGIFEISEACKTKKGDFKEHGVYLTRFSPDGATLVAGTSNGKLLVYDVKNVKFAEIKSSGFMSCKGKLDLGETASTVIGIDFSVDSQWIRTNSSPENSIHYFNLRKMEAVGNLTQVKDLEFVSSSCIYSWETKGAWEYKSKSLQLTCASSSKSMFSSSSSETNRELLAIGTEAGELILSTWPMLGNSTIPLTYLGHGEQLVCTRFNCKQTKLFSLDSAGTLLEWTLVKNMSKLIISDIMTGSMGEKTTEGTEMDINLELAKDTVLPSKASKKKNDDKNDTSEPNWFQSIWNNAPKKPPSRVQEEACVSIRLDWVYGFSTGQNYLRNTVQYCMNKFTKIEEVCYAAGRILVSSDACALMELQSQKSNVQQRFNFDAESQIVCMATDSSKEYTAMADTLGNIMIVNSATFGTESCIKIDGHIKCLEFSPDGKCVAIAFRSEIPMNENIVYIWRWSVGNKGIFTEIQAGQWTISNMSWISSSYRHIYSQTTQDISDNFTTASGRQIEGFGDFIEAKNVEQSEYEYEEEKYNFEEVSETALSVEDCEVDLVAFCGANIIRVARILGTNYTLFTIDSKKTCGKVWLSTRWIKTNGEFLVTGSDDGDLMIVSRKHIDQSDDRNNKNIHNDASEEGRGSEFYEVEAHEGAIYGIVNLHHINAFATGSADGTVKTWCENSFHCLSSINIASLTPGLGNIPSVCSLTLSKTRDILLVTTTVGLLFEFSVDTLESIHKDPPIEGHYRNITAMDTHPKRTDVFVSVSEDKFMYLVRLHHEQDVRYDEESKREGKEDTEKEEEATLDLPKKQKRIAPRILHKQRIPGPGKCVAFSPNGRYVAVGMSGSAFAIFETETRGGHWTKEAEKVFNDGSFSKDKKDKGVTDIKFSPFDQSEKEKKENTINEALLAVSSSTKINVYKCDIKLGNFEKLHMVEHHNFEVLKLNFSLNGEHVFSLDKKSNLNCWIAKSGRLMENESKGYIPMTSQTLPAGWGLSGLFRKNTSYGKEITSLNVSNDTRSVCVGNRQGILKIFSYPVTLEDNEDFYYEKYYVGDSSNPISSVKFMLNDKMLLTSNGQCVFQWKVNGSICSDATAFKQKSRKSIFGKKPGIIEDEVSDYIMPIKVKFPKPNPGQHTDKGWKDFAQNGFQGRSRGQLTGKPETKLSLYKIHGFRAYDCRGSIAYSGCNRLVSIASNFGVVYDKALHQQNFFFSEDQSPLHALSISPNGKWAATASTAGVSIWDANSGVCAVKARDMPLLPVQFEVDHKADDDTEQNIYVSLLSWSPTSTRLCGIISYDKHQNKNNPVTNHVLVWRCNGDDWSSGVSIEMSTSISRKLVCWFSLWTGWSEKHFPPLLVGGESQLVFMGSLSSSTFNSAKGEVIGRNVCKTIVSCEVSSSEEKDEEKGQLFTSATMVENRLVVGDNMGGLRRWNDHLKSNEAYLHKAHENNAIIISMDSHLDILVTGDNKGVIKIWESTPYSLDPVRTLVTEIDLKLQKQIRTPWMPAIMSTSIGFASCKRLLVGCQSSEVYEIALDTGDIALVNNGHSDTLSGSAESWAMAVNPVDRSRYATAADDGTVRMWSSSPNRLREEAIANLQAPMRAIDFAPDGYLLAVGFGRPEPSIKNEKTVLPEEGKKNGGFAVLNASSLEILFQGRDSREWIRDCKFSPNGNSLAVASSDTNIYLYDAKNGFKLKVTCTGGHSQPVCRIDFASESVFIRAVDTTYKLCVYNCADGVPVDNLNKIMDVEWSSCTCTVGWGVQGFWDASNMGNAEDKTSEGPSTQVIKDSTCAHGIESMDATSDNSHIVCGSHNGHILFANYPYLKHLPTRLRSFSAHVGPVSRVLFLHDINKKDDESVASTATIATLGANDNCVFLWTCY